MFDKVKVYLLKPHHLSESRHMPYLAKKIPVSCDESTVFEWVAFMKANLTEVQTSLRQEGVLHEQWYLKREKDGLTLVGVMNVADSDVARKAANASVLEVDKVHRAFKKYWVKGKICDVDIDPDGPPNFTGHELLIDVRV